MDGLMALGDTRTIPNGITHPGFFVVASSLLMILDGDVEALAGKGKTEREV